MKYYDNFDYVDRMFNKYRINYYFFSNNPKMFVDNNNNPSKYYYDFVRSLNKECKVLESETERNKFIRSNSTKNM